MRREKEEKRMRKEEEREEKRTKQNRKGKRTEQNRRGKKKKREDKTRGKRNRRGESEREVLKGDIKRSITSVGDTQRTCCTAHRQFPRVSPSQPRQRRPSHSEQLPGERSYCSSSEPCGRPCNSPIQSCFVTDTTRRTTRLSKQRVMYL